ncbi:hypothetical protein QL285_060684 [Trifolium repens]|nr:hypothetical protein QL285_060684 [Trifolium repens]
MTVQPAAYTILMSLELGSIGIMYQVTTMADMNLPSTMVIFHFSGVVGCETLLWILLPQLWNCSSSFKSCPPSKSGAARISGVISFHSIPVSS